MAKTRAHNTITTHLRVPTGHISKPKFFLFKFSAYKYNDIAFNYGWGHVG